MKAERSKVFQWSFWREGIKENAVAAGIVGILWLVLGWVRSFGVQSALLYPLNFLTGALNGLEGGSFLGGMVGKTLLLLLLNQFVRGLFLHRGGAKQRVALSWTSFRASLKSSFLGKIPQYSNVRRFFTRDTKRLGCSLAGLGSAFVLYSVITGNGSFQNSFVCILLSAGLWKQLADQRGLVVTLVNRLLSRKGRKGVERDYVERVISGNALGLMLTAAYAAVWGHTLAALVFGAVLLLVGALLYLRIPTRTLAARAALFLLVFSTCAPVLWTSAQATEVNGPGEMTRDKIEQYPMTRVVLDTDDSARAMSSIIIDSSSDWDEIVLTQDSSVRLDWTREGYGAVSPHYVNSAFFGFALEYLDADSHVAMEGCQLIRLPDQQLYFFYLKEETLTLTDLHLTGQREQVAGRVQFEGEYYYQPFTKDFNELPADSESRNAYVHDWSTGAETVLQLPTFRVSVQGDVGGFLATDKWFVMFINADQNQFALYWKGAAEPVAMDIPEVVLDSERRTWDRPNGERKAGDLVPQLWCGIGVRDITFGTTPFPPQEAAVPPVTPGAVAVSSVGPAVASVVGSTLGGRSSGSRKRPEDDETSDGEKPDEEPEKPDEEHRRDHSATIVVNKEAPLPLLCATKGASVEIPLSVVSSEVLDWSFLLVALAPDAPKAVLGTALPLGGESAEAAISMTGVQPKKAAVPVFCTVRASAEGDGVSYSASTVMEFILYRKGYHVRLTDPKQPVQAGNLTVCAVEDSAFKGIAELRTLGKEEFVVRKVKKRGAGYEVTLAIKGQAAVVSMPLEQ